MMNLAKHFRQSFEPGTYSCILISFVSHRCVGQQESYTHRTCFAYVGQRCLCLRLQNGTKQEVGGKEGGYTGKKVWK